MSTLPIKEGDTVRVIAPHGEAGAVGTVERIYPANADYRRRARIYFDEPEYLARHIAPGYMTVDLAMLERIDAR